MIEEVFPVEISARGMTATVSGTPDAVSRVSRIFEELLARIRRSEPVDSQNVRELVSIAGSSSSIPEISPENIRVPSRKKIIRPRTPGQKQYIEAIRKNDIVFAIGPAGTGKTYLAVAMAVSALCDGEFRRLVLVRPAVEAGEKLGFLPGTFQEKVDPYLRPLYDALYDMIEIDKFEEWMSRGIIEIAPLAFMRGRTLNDAFIILDEAQNTTPEQMKMFLTRLGFDSKAVVTGDITQIDLSKEQISGLVHVQSVLKGISGIAFNYLTGKDVVRHELVQRIIHSYSKAEPDLGENNRK